MEQSSAEFGKLSFAVSMLEKKLDFLFKQLKLEYKEEEEPYITEAKRLITEGKETEAVKFVRDQTASGLYEAKMVVDEIKKKMM